ncbi:PREDICTED: organic cation/carnitine transporter 7-like [Rhagoletis zephyria]|uniref:organic cation/carnitine transporter 7-like n=1 Tax=Rhagoletis zephyria TaxID=28612 RepID=UPI0008112D47|nr:PREDICTED: organic cation/carnitine transporter 7-like [Rhagoletis zephyria]
MSKDEKEKLLVIDEALEKTGFGKFNICIIIFSGLVLKNVVLESVGVSFALPVLECDLNLSHQEQGVLGAVSFAGVIASSHFWGFLADTTGRKRIMQPALLLGYIVTICSSLSPNFISFAILRFIGGILLSAGSATIFAYLGEFHCQKYRNRAILCGALISATAAIFFPIIAWIFINQEWEFYVPFINITFKPWRSYFLACGVPGFLCGLAMFFLPESPKYLLSAGHPDEAIKVLERMYRINTKNKEIVCPFEDITLLPDADTPIAKDKGTEKGNILVSIMKSMWKQTAPLFMSEHIRKTLLSSLILYIIFFSAHGVYMWFPYILNLTMQYTEKTSEPELLCNIIKIAKSGNLTVANDNDDSCVTHLELSTYKHTLFLEFIYVSLLLLVMYAISKFGRKPILFTILFVCGACGVVAFSIKMPLLAIYLFVVNLCCGLGTTVVNAIVVEIFPTNLRAMAVCISLMIGRIGSVTGSNILGALIETHCEFALFSPSVALIIAGFLGLFLPKASNVSQKANEDMENTP